jgi:phospholipid transport system substrate-binding protein
MIAKKTVRVLLASLFLILIQTAAATDAPNDTPGDAESGSTVRALHDTLLDIMREAAKLGYQGRYDRLAPVLADAFDFEAISRLVVGRHWGELTAEQREQFVDAFTRMTIATYASRFTNYQDEQFADVAHRAMKRGRVMVETELVRPSDENIRLDYLLHQRDGKWRIINVIAKGVSDLALKRAEYESILDEHGFDGLLAKLNEQVARYESEGGGPA